MELLVLSDTRIYGDAVGRLLSVAPNDPWRVRVAHSIADAVIQMVAAAPDILLLDVRVDGAVHGLDVLRRGWPRAYILAIGVDPLVHQPLVQRAGVDEVLPPAAPASELLRLVAKRHGANAAGFAPAVAGRAASRADTLSLRELEVSRLLARGLSNKDIARHLGIELPTVKNHVHNLLRKLNVRTRLQAALLLEGSQAP
ncbi:response regulator transcription factor [Rubrivivax gelatinosus]|uniref:HTH luxR-type domain-containing protein n=1 Tax=Rubrivivax gelatinosus TaxID=28068 RepID=A0ABS1DX45_RUBGE|nr:response regulator transcription factor [Rubrivivax gelatinosus]MBK1714356.1 hypothetical protein [Rubrivivax gelatinosus]